MSDTKRSFRDLLQEKVLELLESNNTQPIAIAIDAKWGVGKTYFWKNELAPEIEQKLKKQVLYTSVFGKRNENEIIQDLVAQFLAKANKGLRKYEGVSQVLSKILELAGGLKFDPTFIFQTLEKKDLQNAIVCIDDFERLSDKIPPQDILGLISELKENKGCHVVVIFNDDELFGGPKSDKREDKNKTPERKIFEKYKEKIFDFPLKFTPPTKEQFNILRPESLDLDNQFSAYKFLPDILRLEILFEKYFHTNLRDLRKTFYIYEQLL